MIYVTDRLAANQLDAYSLKRKTLMGNDWMKPEGIGISGISPSSTESEAYRDTRQASAEPNACRG